MALRRTMGNNRERLEAASLPTISFDASPWGGGGVLWQAGTAVAYTHFVWETHTLETLGASLGDCRYQTAYEFATLFMVAEAFSKVLAETGAMIKGDNLGALSVALKLTSTTPR